MKLEDLFREINCFSQKTHGSSNYYEDQHFVRGHNENEFAPLKYLIKKIEVLKGVNSLIKAGFVFDSYDMFTTPSFQEWFEKQFQKKLVKKDIKRISILRFPDNLKIFNSIESVYKNYEILREQQILLNGKNLPVQLGEWYAKCIFGLQQRKSTSQKGFDFYLNDKRVEVKVHWSDYSSPKGVKIKKTIVDLSDFSVLIYLARNFMIREICFLDSEYIMRKFSGKGHTIFLKDADISSYFFSKSSKHRDKVINSTALMKFASPTLAIRLAENFGTNAPEN